MAQLHDLPASAKTRQSKQIHDRIEREDMEAILFDKIDYTQNPLAKGEYENCTFSDCNFSGSDLSDIKFSECEFLGCNLSLAKLTGTAFRDVTFKDCKMLGLRFENCNQFGFLVSFYHCTLNHSSFRKQKLKKTTYKDSKLEEVDFTESDLSSSVFDNCELTRATFESTILEKADFRTSFGYSIDLELNRVKKAKFSQAGMIGLLDKYDIEIS